MPDPLLTLEQAQSQIAIQITGQPPEVQALVMQCVEISYVAGYNACQRELQYAQALLSTSVASNYQH